MFDDLTDLINQKMGTVCVLIFAARVENEANTFERFNLFFSLEGVATKDGACQRYFL